MILPGALPTLAYSENFPGPLSAFVFSVEEIVLHAVVTDLCVRAAQGHSPFLPGDGGGGRESLVGIWCLLGIAVGTQIQYVIFKFHNIILFPPAGFCVLSPLAGPCLGGCKMPSAAAARPRRRGGARRRHAIAS